jgi:DNA-binding response OmpR family regulator
MYSYLPIILLTAKTTEEDQQKALLSGADGYITKPFKIRDLQLRIDNLVANRQRIRPEAQPAE